MSLFLFRYAYFTTLMRIVYCDVSLALQRRVSQILAQLRPSGYRTRSGRFSAGRGCGEFAMCADRFGSKSKKICRVSWTSDYLTTGSFLRARKLLLTSCLYAQARTLPTCARRSYSNPHKSMAKSLERCQPPVRREDFCKHEPNRTGKW
jgi:hypothetical protein